MTIALGGGAGTCGNYLDQEDVMTLLKGSVVVLGLMAALPARAHAQSGTLADFAGTWVGGPVDKNTGNTIRTDTLILRPDSTFKENGAADRMTEFRRWGRVA